MRYEDQPTLTEALVLAARTSTRWSSRSTCGGSAPTAPRSASSARDPRDLTDRLLTKRWSTDLVVEHRSRRVQDVWLRRVLPIDMWEYFRAVPGCTAPYWAALRDGVREFWGTDTVPFERTGLPLRQRIMGWLVAADQRDDLEEFLAYVDAHAGTLPPAGGRRTRGRRPPLPGCGGAAARAAPP